MLMGALSLVNISCTVSVTFWFFNAFNIVVSVLISTSLYRYLCQPCHKDEVVPECGEV